MIRFDKPIKIAMSHDIRDPDRHIDHFIAETKEHSIERVKLQAIKNLPHELKVKWLLGLPTSSGMKSPEVILTCVFIAIVVTVYVIVGYIVLESGETEVITEQHEEEQQQEVCTSTGTATDN
ncbi:hypothetical protein ACQR1V_05020 [Bradyrhizobium oligotrophicum]|uniref:hypothetical protein n=1 Tax=Bradyrhizobium oligotrophicum TaxID=44255 RepID=UPI003EB99177